MLLIQINIDCECFWAVDRDTVKTKECIVTEGHPFMDIYVDRHLRDVRYLYEPSSWCELWDLCIENRIAKGYWCQIGSLIIV